MLIDKALIQGNIAVLYGGNSSERQVSLDSGSAVIAAFERLGVDIIPLDCDFHVLAEQLKKHKIRHCFNILHGGYGENGEVQAILNSLNISYTGSGVLACAIAMDKRRSKLLWKGAGIPTADFVAINQHSQWQDVSAKLGNKVMIKPANEGSSIGMSVVENTDEFTQALNTAFEYDSNVIAEKWINGPEYTVAIVNQQVFPVIKLETDNRFYDYQAKYLSSQTRYICPCGLSPEDEAYLQKIALEAFEALDCSGWGRVDAMRDSDGQFYLLEANTVPGMTDHSLVPMGAKAAGMSFDQLVAEIFMQSLQP